LPGGASRLPSAFRPGRGFDREAARRAIAGLLEASRGVTFGGLKIKDLIGEERS
jgi:hypothetical protein